MQPALKATKSVNAAVATGAGTAVAVKPDKAIGAWISIATTATVKVETSPDGGTTWMDTSISGKTASGYFSLPATEAHGLVRANVTAWTAGAVNVWIGQADVP